MWWTHTQWNLVLRNSRCGYSHQLLWGVVLLACLHSHVILPGVFVAARSPQSGKQWPQASLWAMWWGWTQHSTCRCCWLQAQMGVSWYMTG